MSNAMTGIHRTSRVLRLIASHQREGLSLTRVAEALELEIPTAHRVLKELEGVKMVERDDHKRYRLGSLVLELGVSAMNRSSLIERFRPLIAGVADSTGDTVFLIARSGDESVCLDRAEGSFPIKTLVLEKGGRRPLGVGGASMHLLAQLDQDEAYRIIESNLRLYPGFYRVEAEDLKQGYLQARKRGYGMNRDGQTQGVTAVGMAIPAGSFGAAQLGIGVACISSRMNDSHLSFVLKEIQQAVKSAAGWTD